MMEKLDQNRRHLEDFAVGQSFVSGTYEMTRDRIIAFAGPYDPQPFHLDDAAAATSVFEGLSASGWHTAAISGRLVMECMQVAGGIVGAGGELTWLRPVRPGDVLQVFSTILAVKPSRSKPDRGIVTVRSETRTGTGAHVQTFEARLLVFRAPGAPQGD